MADPLCVSLSRSPTSATCRGAHTDVREIGSWRRQKAPVAQWPLPCVGPPPPTFAVPVERHSPVPECGARETRRRRMVVGGHAAGASLDQHKSAQLHHLARATSI